MYFGSGAWGGRARDGREGWVQAGRGCVGLQLKGEGEAGLGVRGRVQAAMWVCVVDRARCNYGDMYAY